MKSKILIIAALIIALPGYLFAQQASGELKTKQEKGYFNITEFGFFTGNSSIRIENRGTGSTVNIYSLRTINGIFLDRQFSLGIGIGLDGVDIKKYGFHNTFNAFADLRYYFKANEDGFFVYTDVGSAIKIADNFEKGLLLNLGIGRKISLSDTFMIVPSIGYNQQDFKTGIIKFSNETLALKIGVIF